MRTLLRRAAIVLGVLVLVLTMGAAAAWTASERRLTRRHPLPAAESLALATDAAALERGRHLATTVSGCAACHGADLGGAVVVDHPALGYIAAPNLTTGRGGAASWRSVMDFERAIRHGIAPDGRALLIMPSDDFQTMSDADVTALIAYVRSVPPVDREIAPSTLRPLGRALLVAGQLPVLAAERIVAPRHATPIPAPDAGYGRYLADVGGCTGCHGPGLSGGPIPGAPPEWTPAANLTPAGIGSWSKADFERALRRGVRPDGTPIDTVMPWRSTARMTEDEVTALWAYLRTVPARATGGR